MLQHQDLINAEKDYCSRSLSNFIKRAWHVLEPGVEYKHNWHIDAISEHLEAVSDNQITRLLINVPPGTMKSLCTSVLFPAWEWGCKGEQHLKYISAAHSQDLALRDNIKNRRLIESQWYQDRWKVELQKDQNAKGKFENANMGFRQACAIDSMTGVRADRVIIDDPHSVDSAKSEQKRHTTLETFSSAIPTRLVDPEKSVIIVIMQRLHELDVSGYILEKDLGYTHLCLPMEYEPKSSFVTTIGFKDPRKEEGELLFPDRFPKHVVERDKKIMGSIETAGQFQQRPAPAEGNIINGAWFNYYTTPKKYKRVVISWDTAVKEKQINDPSVATVWGEHEGGYDLLEVYRERLGYPMLKKEVARIAEKYKTGDYYSGHRLLTILIEDKASGQSLIQDMKTFTNYNIVAIMPENDKVTRLSTCSPQIENGKVHLLKGAHWLDDYIKEMTVFPNTTHDDQCDSTSQFLNWVNVSTKGFNDNFFN